MTRDPLQPPPPLSDRDRERLARQDASNGFFLAGGDIPISPTLAGILHVEIDAKRRPDDDESRSLDEARR